MLASALEQDLTFNIPQDDAEVNNFLCVVLNIFLKYAGGSGTIITTT